MSVDTYTSPVIAGHRGFKAKFTENTLTGFKKCFETGATVIETDLWLTKDNVIVISHDKSTKRVFCHPDGTPSNYDIQNSTYDEIKDLVTIGSRERLITFKDLLNWFSDYVNETGSNVHKLQLDIKRPNPTKILKFMLSDMISVKSTLSWWFHRIQFGVWDLNFVKYMNQEDYFQGLFKDQSSNKFGYKHFEIFHISVSWMDSLVYLSYNDYIDSLPAEKDIFRFKITGVSLLYILTWSTGFLRTFVPLLKRQNLKLYSWTVNNFLQFEYLIRVGRAADLPEYGIISDSPDKMVALKKGDGCDDEYLSTELTKLNSRNELLSKDEVNVTLSWSQKLAFFAYRTFTYFGAPTRIRDEEKDFSSFVDENKRVIIALSPLSVWVFTTMQKYGIF